MTCPSTSELAREARDNLIQGSPIPEEELRLMLHSLREPLLEALMTGNPLPISKIADRVDLPVDRIQFILDELGAERNEKGEVIGLGLTLKPTPHEYRVGKKTLYTWCAPDALLFPEAFDHTAHVTSKDPVTGEKITLTVSPDGIEELTPSTTVVSWARKIDARDLRETSCRQGRFFADRPVAKQWQSDHPGTEILSVQKALEMIREADSFL